MPADGAACRQIAAEPPQRQIKGQCPFRDVPLQDRISALHTVHQFGEVPGHVQAPVVHFDPLKTALLQHRPEVIGIIQIIGAMPVGEPQRFTGTAQLPPCCLI